MATLLKNHTLIDENRESTNRTAGHSHKGTKIYDSWNNIALMI